MLEDKSKRRDLILQGSRSSDLVLQALPFRSAQRCDMKSRSESESYVDFGRSSRSVFKRPYSYTYIEKILGRFESFRNGSRTHKRTHESIHTHPHKHTHKRAGLSHSARFWRRWASRSYPCATPSSSCSSSP